MNTNLNTPITPRNSKAMTCADCYRDESKPYNLLPQDFSAEEMEVVKTDGFVACDYCSAPMVNHLNMAFIIHIEKGGYKELDRDKFTTDRELGASELCMHTHTVDHHPIRVWVNEKGTYAYVLTDRGLFVDGCFHLFDSGEVSLA